MKHYFQVEESLGQGRVRPRRYYIDGLDDSDAKYRRTITSIRDNTDQPYPFKHYVRADQMGQIKQIELYLKSHGFLQTQVLIERNPILVTY